MLYAYFYNPDYICESMPVSRAIKIIKWYIENIQSYTTLQQNTIYIILLIFKKLCQTWQIIIDRSELITIICEKLK